MGFMKRAREVAEGAAESAQHAAEAARIKASEVATTAGRSASDPATHERIREGGRRGLGAARRGMTTLVERIDAGTLAELVIKATALQEKTNAALRAKGSPYRINEISIAASIPPGITFTIGRIGEDEVLSGTAVASADLVETLPEAGEDVIALDGTVGEISPEDPEGTV
jgi:hypothetical protein